MALVREASLGRRFNGASAGREQPPRQTHALLEEVGVRRYPDCPREAAQELKAAHPGKRGQLRQSGRLAPEPRSSVPESQAHVWRRPGDDQRTAAVAG